MFLAEINRGLLYKKGMQLNLVDCRQHPSVFEQVFCITSSLHRWGSMKLLTPISLTLLLFCSSIIAFHVSSRIVLFAGSSGFKGAAPGQ